MDLNIDKLIAEELGMTNYLPEIKPTVNILDAWLIAQKIMERPNTQVLIRNCNSSRCGGIRDGLAERGDYFCNIIVGDEEGQRPTTYPTFAPTMPMAVSLAVCKYLGIIMEDDKK